VGASCRSGENNGASNAGNDGLPVKKGIIVPMLAKLQIKVQWLQRYVSFLTKLASWPPYSFHLKLLLIMIGQSRQSTLRYE